MSTIAGDTRQTELIINLTILECKSYCNVLFVIIDVYNKSNHIGM